MSSKPICMSCGEIIPHKTDVGIWAKYCSQECLRNEQANKHKSPYKPVNAFGAGPNGIYEGSKEPLFEYVNCYAEEYAVPQGIMQLAEIREEHDQYEAREHEALRVKDALKTFYLSKQAYIQNKN